jgi:hypothetical protein
MIRTRVGVGLLLGLLVAPLPASAQVKYPPAPAKYEAHFRYRLAAGRDARIRQFRAMEAFLKKLGFVLSPREDADLDIFDPTAERMDGTIPAANGPRLLEFPRILTAVLVPSETPLPEDGARRVQVRIVLTDGLASKQQHELHDEVARHLELLGFREAVGYDHAGYRFLRGSMPAGNVLTLLKDLRTQPSGWFLPAVPPESLPLPLRNVLPIRLVQVLPDLPATAAPPAEPAPPPGGAKVLSPKLSPDLRALLAKPQKQPLRVELILTDAPGAAWRDVRFRIRTAAEGVAVEGLVGSVVTVRVANAADVNRLADLLEVWSVRLPRAGSETAGPLPAGAKAATPAELLAASNVAALHRLGYRGFGRRVAIIASEFPGLTGLIGRQLPTSTQFIDLTAELSPDLLPAPADPNRVGGGTISALLAHAAAPDAQLVLIRILPTAFHQYLSVARSVAGNAAHSEALQSRSVELTARAERLTTRRGYATEEYRRAFADLSDEAPAAKRRQAAKAAMDQLIADERAYRATVERFTALKAALDRLRGTEVVVGTLVWDTGYPQDGLSAVSRYLEANFTPRPVRSAFQANKRPPVPTWVQPASTAVGQVWAGAFRDADGNGAMAFAAPTTPVPPGRWTRELNFLGLRPGAGAGTATLPAGFALRVTVQWREPHDPENDVTREPVFPLALRLLRQLDPAGKTAASDEFVEVGRSVGLPARLLRTPASAAYERTLEVTIPTDGVYALRLEGGLETESLLPALRHTVEIHPRVVVEASDPASAAKGRPVFRTFAPVAVGVGIPGGSPGALTVGILGPNGRPTGTLLGAGPGVQLRTKPDLLAGGAATVGGTSAAGSGVSAAFVGGAAACLRSAGARASDLIRTLGLHEGDALVIPQPWLDSLRR